MFFLWRGLSFLTRAIKVCPCHIALNQMELMMYPIDIPAIERQARELRAAEIQRMNGLFAERTLLLTRLAASSILAGAHGISEMVRPLFSWNPQERPTSLSANFAPAVSRLNNAARALFSWNPQERRS
jgi:hypothetical protein